MAYRILSYLLPVDIVNKVLEYNNNNKFIETYYIKYILNLEIYIPEECTAQYLEYPYKIFPYESYYKNITELRKLCHIDYFKRGIKHVYNAYCLYYVDIARLYNMKIIEYKCDNFKEELRKVITSVNNE